MIRGVSIGASRIKAVVDGNLDSGDDLLGGLQVDFIRVFNQNFNYF